MTDEQHVKLHEASARRNCPDDNWRFRFSSFAEIRRGKGRNANVHRWSRRVHDRMRQVLPEETAQHTAEKRSCSAFSGRAVRRSSWRQAQKKAEPVEFGLKSDYLSTVK